MGNIERIYPDYASALASCGNGYDDSELAEVIAYKTGNYVKALNQMIWPELVANSVFAVAVAAASRASRPLNILDFGGACGIHYHAARASMDRELKWAIVETSIMAKQAASVGLLAFDDLAKAITALGAVDLAHTSGAIQYVVDPLSTLDALIAINAPYFALARFPLWPKGSFVGVQTSQLSGNGPGPLPPGIADRPIRYPITILNIDVVMGKFTPHYQVVFALPAPSAAYVLNGQQIPGVTFVFQRTAK
jgi:putative methyltransferase (TIGR04325 family)